jgi:hypothetical protein
LRRGSKLNKKLTIEWYKTPYRLSEIQQQTGFKFAFLAPKGESFAQATPWVICRDFLQDAVATTINGKPTSIYGFNYNKDKDVPLDLSRIRILVSKVNLVKKDADTFAIKMERSLKLLNHYEKMAKVTKSKMVKYEDDKNIVWVFTGSGFWMKSPVLVSMYTFLIRLGDKEITFETNEELVAEYQRLSKLTIPDNDLGYLKECGNKMHLVIQNYKKLLLPDKAKVDPIFLDEKISTSTIHNSGGIFSFCASQFPDEKRKILLKQLIAGETI